MGKLHTRESETHTKECPFSHKPRREGQTLLTVAQGLVPLVLSLGKWGTHGVWQERASVFSKWA